MKIINNKKNSHIGCESLNIIYINVLSNRYRFIYNNLTSVVHFTFVPVSAVIKMCFTCCRADGYCWCCSFVVGSPFCTPRFGVFVFRIWHCITLFIIVSDTQFLFSPRFFRISHRGSTGLSSSFSSVPFCNRSRNSGLHPGFPFSSSG